MKTDSEWEAEDRRLIYANEPRRLYRAIQADVLRHCIEIATRCEMAYDIRAEIEAELDDIERDDKQERTNG